MLKCDQCGQEGQTKEWLFQHVLTEGCMVRLGFANLGEFSDDFIRKQRNARRRGKRQPDPERDERERRRMKELYEQDPERERRRKREGYKLKLLQLRSATPESCLDLCGDPPYGPIFGCQICLQLFFLDDVVPAPSVPLLTDQQSRGQFVDINFVTSHPNLFMQLGSLHICTKCRKTVEEGNLPAGAALNNLRCTWASHSPNSLLMGQEELECLSLSSIFFTIEGLKNGVQGRRPGLTKKLMLPANEEKDAAWLKDYEGTADSVTWPHMVEDSGPVPVLREGVLTELFEGLLHNHNLYSNFDRDRALDSLVSVLRSVTNNETARLSASQPEIIVGEPLGDHFTSRGPTVYPYLYSVLVPDKKIEESMNTFEWLAEDEDLLVRIGAAAYDLHNEAGLSVEREVPLSRKEWIQHHISHVHRQGLVNQPSLIMAMFLQQVAKTIRNDFPITGSLARVPGSTECNRIIHSQMTAWYNWFGAPAFFFTMSLNASTEIYLATWISHEAGLTEERVEVWHTESELKLLQLLPGCAHPVGPGAYFTHKPFQSSAEHLSRSSSAEHLGRGSSAEHLGRGSCPYHPMCNRDTIELYRDRYKQAMSSPAWLHTISKMFSRHVKKIIQHVLTHPSSGLDIDFYNLVTRVLQEPNFL